MKKPRLKICLIHHSHTDVGYTGHQAEVRSWHVEYLQRAMRYWRDTGGLFRWNVECAWTLESWLDQADSEERELLAQAVAAGGIGLSANYLNFCELADYPLLKRLAARVQRLARELATPMRSAMCADINGVGLGYARALAEEGVSRLLCCVHTHHGVFPLGRRHRAIQWELPDGRKLLLYSAEHYHLGNEFGLVPSAGASYLIKDECDAKTVYHDHRKLQQVRIRRWVGQLLEEGYPFSIVPVMVSGTRSDNAPPNLRILEELRHWNARHGEELPIELCTLDQFFDLLEEEDPTLPVLRGDWPDWWSDGAASAPSTTRRFREAQRQRESLEELGGLNRCDLDTVDSALALYAEHTFGHAESLARPWHHEIQSIEARKAAYVSEAEDKLRSITHRWKLDHGGMSPAPEMPLLWRVVNASQEDWSGPLALFVSHSEYHERRLDQGARILDARDREYSCQPDSAPLGGVFWVWLRLAARQSIVLRAEPDAGHASTRPRELSDGIEDLAGSDTLCLAGGLQTERVQMRWSAEEGLHGLCDGSGLSLLDPDAKSLCLIHERTPSGQQGRHGVRSSMGRNRKGSNVIRKHSRITGVSRRECGALFDRVHLNVELASCSECELEVRAWHEEARLDLIWRLVKNQCLDPENVYFELPLRAGAESRLWVDRAGAELRPWRDQLPGTLVDFTSVQAGYAICGDTAGIAVGTPDTPILQLGPLEYGPRLLAGMEQLQDRKPLPRPLLMSNYWETNFPAGLGGCHEFRFHLHWGAGLRDPQRALGMARMASREPIVYRCRKES